MKREFHAPFCESGGARFPCATHQLVGDFKNAGREWAPKGSPEEVRVHDFLIPELGRAAPYGVYDIGDNAGWVSVGVDHDMAAFAVQTIRPRQLTLLSRPATIRGVGPMAIARSKAADREFGRETESPKRLSCARRRG